MPWLYQDGPTASSSMRGTIVNGEKDPDQTDDHELLTAPILTRDAYVAVGGERNIGQYGLMGKILGVGSKDGVRSLEDPRLYLNTNTPFSAVVCGVQGSGKSHTVSIILESMLVPQYTPIGSLKQPLSGLVLHYGNGGPNGLPSEAAYIGVPRSKGIKTPKVRVYVPKSSLGTRKRVYAPLGANVTIAPLLFDESELDAEAFLTMMAIDSLESAPLYMQIVMSILRDLGETFTLDRFKAELEIRKKSFNPAQLAGLEQRMALLKTFLLPWGRQQLRFAPGRLTIVDLTDTFIDATSACSLFEIVVRLFVRAEVNTGKVLLVDEAHKYLERGTTNGLVKTLLTLVREQRHLAMRVLVSTQEPTVIPPVILDLCTVMVLHRFSSPEWWEHIKRHVSAQISTEDVFEKIVGLKTGQAMVLAPSGLILDGKTVAQIGRLYILMKTRRRITLDGGTSVLTIGSTTIVQ
ncbi:hypothetical protein F5887DRAFT_998620 [Amanita rubescens]|nr:hypothetical protein F5887DRAFT_998620 [Amanita rubescens]